MDGYAYRDGHCYMQLWARAAHLLRCLGQLSVASFGFGWGRGGNVTSAGWQVTPCDVSSCSGEAGLRTAIPRFLTYLLNGIGCRLLQRVVAIRRVTVA